MKFDWDENKDEANKIKHGVTFKEAETVFEDEMAVTIFDEKHSEDEDRFKIIGVSRKLREVAVVHCYRNGDSVTRIISAWRASRDEIKLYERGFGL